MTDDLGEALRMRRAALGGSVAALAADLGEGEKTVEQWLYRTPRGPVARVLARYLSTYPGART